MIKLITSLNFLFFCGITLGSQFITLKDYLNPTYPEGFPYFSYVNPKAPKGGKVRLATTNIFNSVNPYLSFGVPAPGIDRTFATLMASSLDDPGCVYPYTAEKVERSPGRVIFSIRPSAKFHDGTLITVHDVLFSFISLKTYGLPAWRIRYTGITAKILGPGKIAFAWGKEVSDEVAFYLGKMPLFSKAYHQRNPFPKSGTTPALGSGPYRLKINSSQHLSYERIKNWWGQTLPVNKGKYNFDTIDYTLFKNQDASLEAFKRGQYDWRKETNSTFWEQKYQGIDPKKITRRIFVFPGIHDFGAIFFNTQHSFLKDSMVRKGLSLLFDFQSINKKFLHGYYTRNTSIYMGTPYGMQPLPGQKEKELLKSLNVPSFIVSTPFSYRSNTSFRERALAATTLFKKAGWRFMKGKWINKEGLPVQMNLLTTRQGMVRILNDYAAALRQIGLPLQVRLVDKIQFLQEINQGNYDMVVDYYAPVIVPGPEQILNWGPHSLSYIADKTIHILLERIPKMRTLEGLTTLTRCVDRLVHWGYYFIPLWTTMDTRIAYWTFLECPLGQGSEFLDCWWDKRI